MEEIQYYDAEDLYSDLRSMKFHKIHDSSSVCTYWRNVAWMVIAVPNPDELSGKYPEWVYIEIMRMASKM